MKLILILFLSNLIYSGGCFSKEKKNKKIPPKIISLSQGIYVGMGACIKDFKRFQDHFYRISNDKTHYVLMTENLNLSILQANAIYKIKSDRNCCHL